MLSAVQFLGAMETLKVFASPIPAAAAAKLPLEVEQLGIRRPAVLQQPGVDVGPLSAGRAGRDDHMPGAQVVEPDGIARVCSCFVSREESYVRAGA